MLHTSKCRPKQSARQRGLAPLLLAGALAMVGGGGTLFWQSSGWRVEQTADAKVCGIEKDLWQWTGSLLKRADSERQACEALADQPRATCPVIAQTAVDRCSPILGKVRLARPGYFVPIARAPMVHDTGVFSLGMARGASLASRLGRGAHILLSPQSGSEPTDAAVYSLEQQDEPGTQSDRCIGVGVGNQGTILTARHCLRSDAQTTFAASCLDATDTVPVSYVCERVVPDCEKSNPSSCPTKEILDMARCRLDQGAKTPKCFGQSSEMPEWNAPSGLSKVWVAGNASGEAMIVPADVQQGTWPATSEGKALVFAKSTSFFQHGDSGGPVFNQKDRNGQKVVGINGCGSYTACIMPLYLWKDELSGSE